MNESVDRVRISFAKKRCRPLFLAPRSLVDAVSRVCLGAHSPPDLGRGWGGLGGPLMRSARGPSRVEMRDLEHPFFGIDGVSRGNQREKEGKPRRASLDLSCCLA